MFLLIVSLCFFFILPYFVYDAAKKNGHNAFLWSASAAGIFTVAHLFLLLTASFIIGLGLTKWGWTPDVLSGGVIEIILLAILALSIGSVVPILWRVSEERGEKDLATLSTQINQ